MITWALVVCLFVCRIMQKTTQRIFTKYGGNVAHEPREKPVILAVIGITLA